jgi:non-ribosomal peptide synthetase component F
VIFGDRSTVDVHESVARDVPFVDVAMVEPKADGVDAWRQAVANAAVDVDAIAYVMFTSGSTGMPKGVPISYGNLVSYVDGITDLIDFPGRARWTQFFDLSFDLSIHDIFVSQRCEGTLVAPTQIDLMMPGAYVAREKIDVWFSVPVLGAQLGNGKPKGEFGGISRMLFCGEALPVETVAACRPWLSGTGRIWNLYGPTEATIAFTAADVTDSTRVVGNASIGTAFGGNLTALRGQDDVIHVEPSVGAEGELLLGGPQVFAGYSTDAPSPFVDSDGTRFYRSGDLVRIDGEGIYFRGRFDSQVKFRGYRIELGEIESAARRIFNLKTVVVVVLGSHTDAKLAMFYLSGEAGGAGGDTATLDPRRLESTLPKYMIPTEFIPLVEMPTNPNGKIDRRRLVADHDGGR